MVGTTRPWLDNSPRSHALIFLQRVGGGYVFVHRLLLEHFVESPDDRGA